MKKFLLKTMLYALLVFLFFTGFTRLCLTGLHQSDFGNLNEWKEILEGKVNADVWIQGSSRARVHFDTHLLDSFLHINSYNAGMDGSPFDIQYLRWKAYLANNAAPAMVIQHVDLDLLDANESVFQKYQYFPFYNNPTLRPLLLESGILNSADRFLPFTMLMGEPQSIRLGLEALMGKRYATKEYKGFEAHQGEWQGENLAFMKSRPPRDWVVDESPAILFNRFIQECRDKNIRLVLVYSPMYKEVKEVIIDFDGSVELYRQLATKHGIEFYDFSRGELSQDKANFYNATHLNARGAAAFTQQLADSLDLKFRQITPTVPL